MEQTVMTLRRLSAFSLTELLVVIALLAILTSLGTVAFNSTSQGNTLARTVHDVADAAALARQQAMTRNRRAELRFYQLPASTGVATAFRGFQIWATKDDRGTWEPLTRLATFPNGIIAADSAALSPLLQSPPATKGVQQIGGQSREYVAVTLLASGGLESTVAEDSCYLTLLLERDQSQSPPANFGSVAINPITGETSVFRP